MINFNSISEFTSYNNNNNNCPSREAHSLNSLRASTDFLSFPEDASLQSDSFEHNTVVNHTNSECVKNLMINLNSSSEFIICNNNNNNNSSREAHFLNSLGASTDFLSFPEDASLQSDCWVEHKTVVNHTNSECVQNLVNTTFLFSSQSEASCEGQEQCEEDYAQVPAHRTFVEEEPICLIESLSFLPLIEWSPPETNIQTKPTNPISKKNIKRKEIMGLRLQELSRVLTTHPDYTPKQIEQLLGEQWGSRIAADTISKFRMRSKNDEAIKKVLTIFISRGDEKYKKYWGDLYPHLSGKVSTPLEKQHP